MDVITCLLLPCVQAVAVPGGVTALSGDRSGDLVLAALTPPDSMDAHTQPKGAGAPQGECDPSLRRYKLSQLAGSMQTKICRMLQLVYCDLHRGWWAGQGMGEKSTGGGVMSV